VVAVQVGLGTKKSEGIFIFVEEKQAILLRAD
jgi:hypothetical protein